MGSVHDGKRREKQGCRESQEGLTELGEAPEDLPECSCCPLNSDSWEASDTGGFELKEVVLVTLVSFLRILYCLWTFLTAV